MGKFLFQNFSQLFDLQWIFPENGKQKAGDLVDKNVVPLTTLVQKLLVQNVREDVIDAFFVGYIFSDKSPACWSIELWRFLLIWITNYWKNNFQVLGWNLMVALYLNWHWLFEFFTAFPEFEV